MGRNENANNILWMDQLSRIKSHMSSKIYLVCVLWFSIRGYWISRSRIDLHKKHKFMNVRAILTQYKQILRHRVCVERFGFTLNRPLQTYSGRDTAGQIRGPRALEPHEYQNDIFGYWNPIEIIHFGRRRKSNVLQNCWGRLLWTSLGPVLGHSEITLAPLWTKLGHLASWGVSLGHAHI